jgi:hypothetical protein
MKNYQTLVSFLLTIFFIKIKVIQTTTHYEKRIEQMLSDQAQKDKTFSSQSSDIFIVYNGKQLVNNSIVRVPEGEALTLMCVENKRETENNKSPSSSQNNSPTLWNDESLRASLYGWYSDGVIISNTQTLTLPNAYSDTLPSSLTCAIHGSFSQQYITDTNKQRDENSNKNFQNEISISKENIIKQTTVQLQILSPPSFTIRRIPAFGIPVVEGMTVVLSCDIEIDQSSIPISSDSEKDNIVNPKWMKNEVPVNDDDYGGRLKDFNGAVTIMSVEMSDVGWYQCYTEVDGENYSSIGYFLNVKPSDEFPDEHLSIEDDGNEIYDDNSHQLPSC